MKAGTFYKVTLSFAIGANSQHPHEAALLINYLLNDPEGVAIMGTQRGIPASKAAYSTLEEAGTFDEQTMDAHTKIFAAAQYFLDTGIFDDSSLKDATNGAYADGFGGLDYGDYDVAGATEVIYNAFQEVSASFGA